MSKAGVSMRDFRRGRGVNKNEWVRIGFPIAVPSPRPCPDCVLSTYGAQN